MQILSKMPINIDNFISEIEKTPPLHNEKLKEYSNKDLKKKLWMELCEKFIQHWSEIGFAEKEEKGKLYNIQYSLIIFIISINVSAIILFS